MNNPHTTTAQLERNTDTGRLPLQGIRIADFSWAGTGPYSTQLLSFLGAEVIKIESRTRPDQFRQYARSHGWDDGAVNLDASPQFAEMNMGKFAVGLNLKNPKALDLVRKIVEQSDVVIENMTPGTFTRLGFGYEDLRRIKSDIILCSISGRGSHGAGPAYAGIFAAMGGLSYLSGYADGMPGSMRMPVDLTCGTFAALGVLAALWQRAQTGEGRWVDLACQEVTTALVGDAMLRSSAGLGDQKRVGNDHAHWAPHDCYPCAGKDEWISIAVRTDAEWHALCKVIGRPDLVNTPQTASAKARRANKALIDAALGAWTAPLKKHDAMALLQAARVAAMPSFNFADLEHDPHLRAQNAFGQIEQPHLGKLSVLAAPWNFRRHPLKPVSPAPILAQHNDYVLRDLLGLSSAEIEQLIADGAVERPTPRAGDEALVHARPPQSPPAPAAAAPVRPAVSGNAAATMPLSGITVLEVATSSAAGYCGRLLRDLGARVVKVSAPTAKADVDDASDDVARAYENAGKESITLDIASVRGQAYLLSLVDKADMVISDEQPDPDRADALTLAQRLAQTHPSLVVVSITPFGVEGLYATYRCAPLNSYHAGGQGYLFPPSLEDLHRPPLKSAGNVGEYESGAGAALAALSALWNRRVTGEGELIDFSRQHWGMNLNRPFHPRYTINGVVETRATQAYPWGGVFSCADGDLLLLALQDNQWDGLLKAMDSRELEADERFTSPGKRHTNGRALRQVIATWMRTQPRATVLDTLATNGTPAGAVQTPPEVLNYPIYKTRGFLQSLPLPGAPQAVAPGLPFRLGASPVGIAGPAPVTGAHNATVYRELLGLSEQDITTAAAEGVI
jgi:benzylsuccinate CoA-transferase BbsF subunit